jgi:hypothetical protein
MAFILILLRGAWSQLKRTIKSTHIHVSVRYLQLYVDEVAFRLMHKDKQDTMFETILSHVVQFSFRTKVSKVALIATCSVVSGVMVL